MYFQHSFLQNGTTVFRVVIVKVILACENISFSSLFAAEDETSSAAKSEEKRRFCRLRQFCIWANRPFLVASEVWGKFSGS